MKKLILSLLLISSAAYTAPFTKSFRDFTGGLNNTTSPIYMPDNMSPEMYNMVIDEEIGVLKSRKGYTACSASYPTGKAILNIYEYNRDSGTRRLIATDGESIYATGDCANWTLIKDGFTSGTLFHFATVQDKLWAVSLSTNVVTWDGSTATLLNGTGTTANPPKANLITYWKNRVWLANTSNNSSELAFSVLASSSGVSVDPATSGAFNSLYSLYVNRSDGGAITGLYAFRDRLFIFKEQGIWVLTFVDEYNLSLVQSVTNIGCISGDTIREYRGRLLFLGRDSVYAFNGETVEPISKQIQNIIYQSKQPSGQTAANTYQNTADFSRGTTSGNAAIDTYIYISSTNANKYATAFIDPIGGASGQIAGKASAPATNFSIQDTIGGYKPWLMWAGNLGINDTWEYVMHNTATPLYGSKTFTVNPNAPGAGEMGKVGDSTRVNYILVSTSAALSPGTMNMRGISFRFINRAIQDISGIGRNTALYVTTVNYTAGGGEYGSEGGIIGGLNFDGAVDSADNVADKYIDAVLAVNGDLSIDMTINVRATLGGAIITTKTGSVDKSFLLGQSTTTYQGFLQNIRGVNTGNSGGQMWYYEDKESKNNVSSGTWISEVGLATNITNWLQFSSTTYKAGLANIHDVKLYARFDASPTGISTQAWTTISEGSITASTTTPYIQLKADLWDIPDASTASRTTVSFLQYSWFSGTPQTYAPKAIVYDDRYYLGVSTSATNSYADTILKLSLYPQAHWTKHYIPCQAFSLFFGDLYCAKSSTSSVIKLETGETDNGTAIPFSWESGDQLINSPYLSKYVQYMFVDYLRDPSLTLTLGLSIDGGLNWTSYPFSGGQGLVKTRGYYKANVTGAPSTMFRTRLSSSGVSKRVSIYGLDIIGYTGQTLEGGR